MENPTIHQKIEVWKIQPFTQKIEVWKIQPFTKKLRYGKSNHSPKKLSHGTTLAIEEIYEVWKTQSLNRENQG